MDAITTFDSTKESLQDLVKSIREGKTQLPDFQRGWVWDDEHIRSLLASISLSYPIGAVMMLQTGGEGVRFKPRLVEGVDLARMPEPERLIMDGQQRLTSLFLALASGKPVHTKDAKGTPLERWYYLDIAKALSPNGDRDEAIVGVPADRMGRNFRGEVVRDYSTMAQECAAELFPLPLVFDTAGLTTWQMAYLKVEPTAIQQRLERWNALVQSVIQRFQQYQIPVILLRKETPKEAVCQVFEKVNTGGVSLTVFELLTATYATDDFRLREDWERRDKQLRKLQVLTSIENTDFLQAVSLLASRARRERALAEGVQPDNAPGISCKRKDILRLTLDEYRQWADPVLNGFLKAAKLLHAQRIFAARDLPYRTQLTPLAAILAVLGDRADADGARAKLARWYWCGVFGELYGGAIETRFAKDLPDVVAWVQGGPEPSTIQDASFAPARLLTLRTRNSAAYKGLSALLLRDGGLDFRTGEPIEVQTFFDDKVDIHHIFPRDWCAANGVEDRRADSIVNKTPLAARTNRMIGGNAPSQYLGKLERHAGIQPPRMDEILASHVIESVPMRGDQFDQFFSARQIALLRRIEGAMGKPVLSHSLSITADGLIADAATEEAEAGV